VQAALLLVKKQRGVSFCSNQARTLDGFSTLV
jgi:hypothetical protein